MTEACGSSSKVRDSETGLDWFSTRYMSRAQGRFQSVDPGNAGADPTNPQTWNAYSYVGNNPLSYSDPSGQCWWCTLLGIGLDIEGFFKGGTTTILGSILTTAGTVAAGGSIGGGFDVGGFGGSIGGGANSDPWSDQIPYDLNGGGPLNTGSVYGSGNTGPGVFSLADPAQAQSSWSGLAGFADQPWVTRALFAAGTFSAGAADFLTFGVTKKINQWDGGAATIDYSSKIYTAGKITGIGLTIAAAAAGGATAAAVADGKNGAYFGRGTASVFNNGKVRFGWYWKGPASTGRNVIGLRIGAARGTSWYSHLPFWYPK
jgi:RHS repeat-associated protein